MVNVNVEFDKKKYADIMHKVSMLANEDQINKAINRAAKRAADTAKAETVRQLSSEYTLPTKEIRGTIATRNLRGGDIGAVMEIQSGPFALPKFTGTIPKEVMPPAKGPVRAEVKKGSSFELARAFVAKMKSGHVGVYERKTEKNTPLEQHFGPATTGMFKANEKVNEAVMEKVGETFNGRVIHELERLMYG